MSEEAAGQPSAAAGEENREDEENRELAAHPAGGPAAGGPAGDDPGDPALGTPGPGRLLPAGLFSGGLFSGGLFSGGLLSGGLRSAGLLSEESQPGGQAPGGPAPDLPAPTGAAPAETEPAETEPAETEPGEPELDEPGLRAALEAILLVVDEPVADSVLAKALEQPAERVTATLHALSEEYTAAGRGFDLRRAAGGWRLYTRPEQARYVERFVLDGQQARLSQAALETLAVIAYKQPVTRSRVSAIRGVNCDGVIRTLLTRGLVEEAGTEPETGAYLYRTTNMFLEKLGLDSLDQLPPLAPFLPDDVDALDPDARDLSEARSQARDPDSAEPAGTDSAGTESAGTGSAGTDSADAGSAGTSDPPEAGGLSDPDAPPPSARSEARHATG